MSTDLTAKNPDPAPPGGGGKASGDGLLQLMLGGMRRNMRQYGMLMALGLIVVLFAVWSGGDLLLPRNVSNLVLQNSYILILAIGMMLVIIAGHIDLSVGSLTAFIGAMSAVLMVEHDLSWPLAVVLCLAVGAVAGSVQGFFIAYLGIPSFIVTLAGMLLFRGLTEIVLKGQTLGPFPKDLQKIANGFLPEVGPDTNYHNLTLLLGFALIAFVVLQEVRDRKRQQEFALDVPPVKLFLLKLVALVSAVLVVTLLLASYKGAPVVLLILGVLVVGFGYLMRNAVIGRHIYAIGGLRHRRQPARGQAVGREGQEGHLPGLPEHGHARGPGGPGLRRPLQRGLPQGGPQLRTGGHRGLVHRRRVDERRCRHGARRHHRRSGARRPEQRDEPRRHRHRLAAGHQGRGAAGRGRLRRLEQAQGRLLTPDR